MFDQFGANTCQRDRPVVRSSMPISFFENRGYISPDPSIGQFPCLNRVLKNIFPKTAFLRGKFGSSSGPDALSAFNSLDNLVMPDSVISILSMSFVGGPSNLSILVVSSSVNTEQSCWLRISALCLLFECSWLSCNKGETPHLSWRCDFIYIAPERLSILIVPCASQF